MTKIQHSFLYTLMGYILLFAPQGLSMKPAPFTKITFTDPHTDMKVISNPNTNHTQVLDAKGKEIWSMDIFIGRRKVFLSNDGKFLILMGNHYFGNRIKIDPKAYVLEYYSMGKKEKQWTFIQAFGLTIQEAVTKYQVPVLGGGWIYMDKFISIDRIDWSTKKIYLTYKDNQQGSISF